jgi:transposase
MIIDFDRVDIYVKPGKTDMRKQINGLAVIVQQELKLDPFSGSLFLFCNGGRRLLKILYWDKTGFALWLKRLEKDRFFWPMDRTEVQEIDFEQLRQLLSGINFWEAHKEVNYSSVL